MKILITGAKGMVAKATAKYCRSNGDEVVVKSREELDISNENDVFRLLQTERFDAVLNCAAYTDVDGAEVNREKSFAANSIGVENLALAAKQTDAQFVTISTDYVFDGTKGDFYTQNDSPNPRGVYAQSKLDGENRAMQANTNSIIARTGWIFGTEGTNFLSVMPSLLSASKGIKAISDSYGTPTFANDLGKRLRDLAELKQPGIYHVCNDGFGTTFAEFALRVCEIGGFDKNLVEIVSMDSLKRPAPRPRDSRLKCLLSEKRGLAPLQNWEKALLEFMSED